MRDAAAQRPLERSHDLWPSRTIVPATYNLRRGRRPLLIKLLDHNPSLQCVHTLSAEIASPLFPEHHKPLRAILVEERKNEGSPSCYLW